MTQRRYVNFGADANAASMKAVYREQFGPQVLNAVEPFLSAATPDQLVIQPHSVIFENGIVLVEDEQLEFTVPTGWSSADYTLAYQHVDENLIGGTVATLELHGGLFESLESSVILGWVRYPGGAVQLDNSMVLANRLGRVTSALTTRMVERIPSDVCEYTLPATATVSLQPRVMLSETIPSVYPYTISLGDAYVSHLLPTSSQILSMYSQTDKLAMTRITSGTPTTGQFLLSSTTRMATFSAADAGKLFDFADLTYGLTRVVTNSDPTASVTIDSFVSFSTFEIALKQIVASVVALHDYSIEFTDVIDVTGRSAVAYAGSITSWQSDNLPSVPDGSLSQLKLRLLDGTYSSTTGGLVIAQIRETLGPLGIGMILGLVATNRDLPF